MDLNKLLTDQRIDTKAVHALRHRPSPLKFARVLPWLAAERHDLFNAYQQSQGPQVEKAISKAKYVVSCIAHGTGKALFIGLYEVKGWRPITMKEYWEIPENVDLTSLGNPGFLPEQNRETLLWFDLAQTDVLSTWKGKLVVNWPPPTIKWHRPLAAAHMPVLAIHEDSALVKTLPAWDEIDLGWAELNVIPSNLKAALAQWRGIYLIYDISDRMAYVGSAYGHGNLLGRWQNYGVSRHGSNKLLLERKCENFRFTILQRVSPDMDADEVIRVENTWKERLHTRHPFGLNDNWDIKIYIYLFEILASTYYKFYF